MSKPPERSNRKRTLVGIADQAVWSLGNVVFVGLVASRLSGDQFGGFVVTMALVVFATGVIGAFTYEAMLLGKAEERHRDSATALGLAAALGAAAGILVALMWFVLPEEGRLVAPVFGAALPLLAATEVRRGLAGLSGRTEVLLAGDIAWTVLSIIGVLIVARSTDTAAPLAAVWGGTSLAALLIHHAVDRMAPNLDLRGWYQEHGNRAWSFGFEYTVSSGAAQLVPALVGVVAGLPAAGVLRLAQVAFGPFTSLTSALRLVYAPQLRAAFVAGRPIRRRGLAVGAQLAVLAAVWGTVITLLPVDTGTRLLGDLWSQASDLVPLASWQRAAAGLSTGAILVGRAAGLVSETRWRRLVIAVATISGATLGAQLDGARGALIALALAQSMGTLLWWSMHVRRTQPSAARA